MTDEHRECLRRAHFWRRKPTVDGYFATLKLLLDLESGQGDFEVLTPEEEDGLRVQMLRAHGDNDGHAPRFSLMAQNNAIYAVDGDAGEDVVVWFDSGQLGVCLAEHDDVFLLNEDRSLIYECNYHAVPGGPTRVRELVEIAKAEVRIGNL